MPVFADFELNDTCFQEYETLGYLTGIEYIDL